MNSEGNFLHRNCTKSRNLEIQSSKTELSQEIKKKLLLAEENDLFSRDRIGAASLSHYEPRCRSRSDKLFFLFCAKSDKLFKQKDYFVRIETELMQKNESEDRLQPQSGTGWFCFNG